MGVIRGYAWIVFVLFALMATLFGAFPGTWFDEGGDTDQQLLLSTYAAAAAVLSLAVTLVPFRRGERWAWTVLWVWPAFFVVHGLAFFAFDFVFAALGVIALLVTAPRPAAAPRTVAG
jgi:hypothetical protein